MARTEHFLTEEEFLEWKKVYEHETNEQFVKNIGVQKSAYGSSLVYDCNRSGFDKKKPMVDSSRTEAFKRS